MARAPGDVFYVGCNRVEAGLRHVQECLIGMLDKNLKEEQAPGVDERLVRVVRIIVEEYGGDVEAFVESIRCRVELVRRDETMPGNQIEAAWRRL